jgi:hypothetical protein
MENYYKDQLKKLNIDSEYPLSIKIFDGQGNTTNQLDLNKESIQALKMFISQLELKLGLKKLVNLNETK